MHPTRNPVSESGSQAMSGYGHSIQPEAGRRTMKAVMRDRYGPVDVLEIRNIEQPVPRDDEVMVRVHAASINDWDWGLLHGPTLPISSGPPRVRILGSDIAGRVVAL